MSWALRAFMAAVAWAAGKEFERWLHDIVGSVFGFTALAGIDASPEFLRDAAEKLNKMAVANNAVAFGLAADTLHQITGVGAPSSWVAFLAERPPNRLNSINIGESFFPVVTNMFDVTATGEGNRSRLGGGAWRENLNAFFGTNLLFQMRSLTISTISRMTGLESLRHLEGLHQTVNWAFGFGWLSWAVMSNYMNVCINDQMTKELNARTLGKDMTLSQAVDAMVRGYLDKQGEEDLWAMNGIREADRDIIKSLNLRLLTIGEAADAHLQGKMTAEELDTALHRQAFDTTKTDILLYQRQNDLSAAQAASAWVQGWIDDQGYEQHVNRAMLTPEAKTLTKKMVEKEMADSELRDLWQERQIDEQFLTAEVRHKGFGAEKAAKIVWLLQNERLQKLRDELVTRNRRLFVDCVIEESELRTVLTQANYTQAEADQAVANDLVARRTRQFMPINKMVKAIKAGLLDVNDAMQSLQCRGWTYDDAVVDLILELQDKLPPCDDVKLEEKAMIGLLQALGTSLGISGKFLKPNVLKYLQCLNAEYLLLPPIAELTADKTTVVGADRVILTWKTRLATSATIEPLLGPVPLEGSTGVDVKRSGGFKLTAKSPIGTSFATVFIDVVPAPPI